MDRQLPVSPAPPLRTPASGDRRFKQLIHTHLQTPPSLAGLPAPLAFSLPPSGQHVPEERTQARSWLARNAPLCLPWHQGWPATPKGQLQGATVLLLCPHAVRPLSLGGQTRLAGALRAASAGTDPPGLLKDTASERALLPAHALPAQPAPPLRTLTCMCPLWRHAEVSGKGSQ